MISHLALVVFLACFIGLIVLAWVHGIFWGAFLTGVLVLLAITEIVSKMLSGRTISQKFSAWRKKHPILGWLTFGLFSLGMLGLALHLWVG